MFSLTGVDAVMIVVLCVVLFFIGRRALQKVSAKAETQRDEEVPLIGNTMCLWWCDCVCVCMCLCKIVDVNEQSNKAQGDHEVHYGAEGNGKTENS
mgnify:CR=1 FL=1